MSGLSAIVSCFLMMDSKYSYISDIEYDSSGKSNSLFLVAADILVSNIRYSSISRY